MRNWHWLETAAIGVLVVLGLFVGLSSRRKPALIAAPNARASASTQVAFPAPQPIEERLRNQDAQDAWLRRRDLEFDKCAELHGTPTLGFGMRVVCLDSRVVKFVGEEHPQ